MSSEPNRAENVWFPSSPAVGVSAERAVSDTSYGFRTAEALSLSVSMSRKPAGTVAVVAIRGLLEPGRLCIWKVGVPVADMVHVVAVQSPLRVNSAPVTV